MIGFLFFGLKAYTPARTVDLESSALSLFKSFIFVVDVGYEANVDVLEGALLLQLVPLLVEDAESLGHGELLEGVHNEVINDHLPLGDLGLGLRFIRLHGC